uniref:Uncharacterized protein n=1 Tax=Utricularia reniformis TaxID=192314 RepID=A0A1Y0B2X2_9LAMI|nr:hypothetical protein AEK19_MT1534 [Utricularia reniformis]ART31723.1 hypothetical protein AEK19_MT1534 [Utricularia reniformis]
MVFNHFFPTLLEFGLIFYFVVELVCIKILFCLIGFTQKKPIYAE